jgi:hypothetical protein
MTHRLSALLVLAAAAVSAAEPVAPLTLPAFLADRGIDRSGRAALADATTWDDEAQRAAIRVLARRRAPAELWMRWQEGARNLDAGPHEIDDRLVRVGGRAVFVAPEPLTAEQARLLGGPRYDVVRVIADSGTAVDVLVASAPEAWARWQTIDEPVEAVGLPLSAAVGPRPGPSPADRSPWPEDRAALLLAAKSVAWHPATPLGDRGVDCGLFATVVDGKGMQPGDTDAFYAVLAAVGRGPDAAGPPAAPTDIVPIISAGRRWFADNRGAPVTIVGTARRATRIAVDDPVRRSQVGSDHYWELFVFVDTPPIKVNDRDVQDTYPVVCCVRELTTGMPTGDRISERVRVDGFAFKCYSYPLADVLISSSQGDREIKGDRMETALVLGRRAAWTPPVSPARATSILFWVFSGLTAAVAAVLAYGMWAMSRDAGGRARRARDELPEKIRLPDGQD